MNERSEVVQGSYLELSEHKNFLELTNLVCYYNDENANGRQLNYDGSDEEKKRVLDMASTLCLMPVYAKCTVTSKKQPTFGNHGVKRLPNGEIVFETIPIGVHTDVAIEEREVVTVKGEKKVLPCLIGKQRVWTRNKHATEAIKRLYASGDLHNSWEMEVSEYEYVRGKKILKTYEFVGNCFLAKDCVNPADRGVPAYGNDAQVLSVATSELDDYVDCELMIAEALQKDIQEQSAHMGAENEVNEEVPNEQDVNSTLELENAEIATEQENVEVEVPEVSETTDVEAEQPQEETAEAENTDEATPAADEAETSDAGDATDEQPETEASALTTCDLNKELDRAFYNATNENAYLQWLFPAESIAWFHRYRDLETKFVQVSYTVEGNKVTIGEMVDVEIALPIRELTQAYSEAKAKVEELSKEVSELKVYKDKLAAAEAAEAEQKHQQEVSALRELAEKSKCFSESELSEMNDLFENVKVLEVKAAIADKKMAAEGLSAEVSAVVVTAEPPKSNLEADMSDKVGTFRSFLKK